MNRSESFEGSVMKYPLFLVAVSAATLTCGAAMAQTTPSNIQGAPSPVVTDVGPAPAQERNSVGAVVLEDSMVLAQRRAAFERSSLNTGVASVGRGVIRKSMKEQTRSELAQAREDAAVEFYQRGAGSLTPK
jgi:Trp operon repressor